MLSTRAVGPQAGRADERLSQRAGDMLSLKFNLELIDILIDIRVIFIRSD